MSLLLGLASLVLLAIGLIVGAIAPNPELIVYGTGLRQRGEVLSRIYIQDLSRNLNQVLTHGHEEFSPDMSPTTGEIVYVTRQNNRGEVMLMDSSGRNKRAITQDIGLPGNPAWSPDGQQIAFDSAKDFSTNLYLMNTDGTELQQLLSESTFDADPSWSPDGTQLAFHSNRSGSSEIFVLNVASREFTQITESQTSSRQPAWSPTSDVIAHVSNIGGIWRVFTTDIQGNTTEVLFPTLQHSYFPEWSPDGQQIAFETSHTTHRFQLFTTPADTITDTLGVPFSEPVQTLVRLFPFSGRCHQLSWGRWRI